MPDDTERAPMNVGFRSSDTHAGPADEPRIGGRQRVYCGEWVPIARIVAEPTCPRCRQIQQQIEAAEL